jgi:hypothetical protein
MGFEIGLHLHPQWYKGRYENGTWLLDYTEYNLCRLPRERINQLVDQSLRYLQSILGEPDLIPLSFRAGNWLMQPTQTAACVLVERGIKVDSSVFKGGFQNQPKLDYRRALKNGFYWRFMEYVDLPDPNGTLLEVPIFTQMVPIWRMLTGKRISIQRQSSSAGKNGRQKLNRILDFVRFHYPLKLDFCRMTMNELTHAVNRTIKEDQQDPASFKPLVAIGHTKDLVDFETIERLLSYLEKNGIQVSTFQDIYTKCTQ